MHNYVTNNTVKYNVKYVTTYRTVSLSTETCYHSPRPVITGWWGVTVYGLCYNCRTVLLTTAQFGKSQLPIFSLNHANKRQAKYSTFSGETGSVTKLFNLN